MIKTKLVYLFILILSFLIYIINIFFNNYNIEFNNIKNKNKIIAVIFAGRKKYLENLMIYLNIYIKIIKFNEISFLAIHKK